MNTIIDLKTNKEHSIFSEHGKKLLKMYVKYSNTQKLKGGVNRLGSLNNINNQYEFTSDVITLERLIAEPEQDQKIVVKNSEGHYYFWTSAKEAIEFDRKDSYTRRNIRWIKAVPFNYLKIWENNNNRPSMDDIPDNLLGPILWSSENGFDEQQENNMIDLKNSFNREKRRYYEQQTLSDQPQFVNNPLQQNDNAESINDSAQIEQLKKEHTTIINNIIEQSKNEKEFLKNEHQNKMNELKQQAIIEHENKMNQLKQLAENKINELREQIVQKDLEIQQTKSYADQFHKNKVNQLEQQLLMKDLEIKELKEFCDYMYKNAKNELVQPINEQTNRFITGKKKYNPDMAMQEFLNQRNTQNNNINNDSEMEIDYDL